MKNIVFTIFCLAFLFYTTAFSQQILFLTPDQGMQGTENLQVNLVATGVNFYDEYSYNDVYFSGDGLNATNEHAVSNNVLEFDLDIESWALIGNYTVYLHHNSDWGDDWTISKPDAFTVLENPAEITSIEPDSIQAGTIGTLTIYGYETYWNETSSVEISGGSITINWINFISETEIEIEVSVDRWAYTGWRDVTVVTGNLSVSLQNGLLITPPEPLEILSIEPEQGGQGSNDFIVTIEVNDGNFYDEYAGREVSFSGNGITVENTSSITDDILEATIDISSWADVGSRDVTVGISGPWGEGEWEWATAYNAFYVDSTDHELVSITPNQAYPNTNNMTITLLGANTNWASYTPELSFEGSGIHVDWVNVITNEELQAQIDVYSWASSGFRDVVVTSGDQIVGLQDGFEVRSPEIISLTPNSGVQGDQNLNITLVAGGVNFYDPYSYINNIWFSGSGLNTSNYNVTSSTTVDFELDIQSYASTGLRDVYLNGYSDWDYYQISKQDAFEVLDPSEVENYLSVVSDTTWNGATSTTVSINLENYLTVGSLQFILADEPEYFTATNATTPVDGFDVLTTELPDGSCQVTIYSLTRATIPPGFNDTVCEINYTVIEGAEDVTVYLEFNEINLLNPSGEPINVTGNPGYIVFGEGAWPDIDVEPLSLSAELFTGDVDSSQVFTITNEGESDLVWELEIEDQTVRNIDNNFNHPGMYYLDLAKGEEDPREGPVVTRGSGGPDIFGYTWIDSDEPGGPNFEWEDISATGININGNMSDDNVSGPYPLGFEFPYYENTYTEFYVSSNGFIRFEYNPDSGCCSGQPIPFADGLDNIIAWAWRDGYPFGNTYYKNFADKTIIQFDEYGLCCSEGNGSATVEIILYSNGRIKINYLELTGNYTNGNQSIGIENSNGTDGLQVAFNTDYLHDELAVLFSTSTEWITIDSTSGTIPAGSSQDIQVTFDATNLLGGDYLADIVITSNDPDEPEVIVDATLTVTGAPSIVVDSDSLDFGEVFVDGVYSEVLTVSNIGMDVLDISEIQSDNGYFSVGTAAFSLEPGEDYVLEVVFAPTEVGLQEGLLTIFSNDPSNAEVTITLTGTGVTSPDITVEPMSLSANLFAGDIDSSQMITITNDGGSDLEWEIDISENRSASNNNRNIGFYADHTNSINVEPIHHQNNHNGFNMPRDVGDVLATYEIEGDNYSGMAWSEGYLWLIHWWNFTLIKYDINTQQIVESYGIHNEPYGMAWDGQYFWIGTSSDGTVIRGYDTQGNLIGDFNGPQDHWPGITWDGQYLWLSEADCMSNPLLYQVDIDGTVIRTLNSDLNGETATGLAWIEEHEEGQLWISGLMYNSIHQVDISGDIAVSIESFISPTYDVYCAFTHDGTDLWILGNYGSIYQIDDGIEEQLTSDWLSTSETSGTVSPGSSQTIDVIFDATDQNGGDYSADIVITSNDPDESEVIVDATLTVTGAPSIIVDSDSLDYGEVFVDGVYSEGLLVSNIGTDVLDISEIQSDNGYFSVDVTSFSLEPGEDYVLEVIFAPTEVDYYEGTLTISSNDPSNAEVYVTMSGTSVTAPDISVNPLSLSSNLFTGDIDSSQVITITNDGGSDLEWELAVSETRTTSSDRNIGFYADETRLGQKKQLPNIKQNKNINSNRDEGDIIAEYWSPNPEGATGMVWVGEDLYVISYEYDEVRKVNPFTGEFISSFPTNENSSPYGITWDGQYLWVGRNNGNIYGYDLDGNPVGSFSSPVYDYLALTWDGEYFLVAQVWDNNPIFYKIDYEGNVIEAFTSSFGDFISQMVWVPGHDGGNLWTVHDYSGDVRRFDLDAGSATEISSFYISVNESRYAITHDGTDLWTADWYGPYYQIDDGIEEQNWLYTDIASGTISAGSSQDIQVTFDATNLLGGEYLADIVITSNDPDESEVIVDATLTVTGAPSIVVDSDSLDFGEVFVDGVYSEGLLVSNIGTDVLDISEIQSDNGYFSVDVTSFSLEPGEDYVLEVIFAPTEVDYYEGTLTISSNDPSNAEVYVTMSGTSVTAPDIVVEPMSLSANLFTGDIDSSQVITITNDGGSELDYQINLLFQEFEYLSTDDYVPENVYSYPLNKIGAGPSNQLKHTFSSSNITPLGSFSRNFLNILILETTSSYNPAALDEFVYNIENFEEVELVSSFYAGDDTPTSELMSNYDLVIFTTDALYLDVITTCENVVTYIEGGGKVILTTFAWANQGGNTIAGTLLEQYSPFQINNESLYSFAELGDYIEDHPIFDNVNEFSSYFRDNVTLSENANLIASWSDDHLFIAEKGMVLGINSAIQLPYPEHSSGWQGDGWELIHNAILYMTDSLQNWLSTSATSGTVSPGSSQTIDVIFDATDQNGGDYSADIVITSNDPDEPEVTVPATLTVTDTVTHDIALMSGWNIFSSYTIPEDLDMLSVVQQLIDADVLDIVIDETGNSIVYFMGTWLNNIGDFASTEGYYLKVSDDAILTIEGMLVTLPFEIGLAAGWSILGYPADVAQDALVVVQPLINAEELYIVIDEAGNSIVYFMGTWLNNIGDFAAGEGYYIKVNTNTSLTINTPSLARTKTTPIEDVIEKTSPSHFSPEFTGNPFMPMGVYLIGDEFGDLDLEKGDEVAVFDNNLCVGASVVKDKISIANPLIIITSMDDEIGMAGFSEGNPISYRIWDASVRSELLVSEVTNYDVATGNELTYDPLFEGLGAIAVGFKSYVGSLDETAIPESFALHQNYPNPFNPVTTIRYELPEQSFVTIVIYDILGRTVKQLVNSTQGAGFKSVQWNATDSFG
ncbi:MAG: choice-of-anchor D domain-containing protein, partial [Candidatus Cloacimonetes bacterium]|nr:choice-of-anchor D domain-containing protein [Candidatus Cloacimonadota bacterium]